MFRALFFGIQSIPKPGQIANYGTWPGLQNQWFVRPFLLLPMLVYSWKILRSRRMRPALILSVPFLFAVALVLWVRPDYEAAGVAVLYLVMLLGLRYVWALRWHGARVGRHLGIALVLATVLSPFAWRLHLFHTIDPQPFYSWCCTHRWPTRRAEIERRLESTPGEHLVLVRYPAKFNIFDEWVYNAADIDRSRIIWARSLDPTSDRELLNYYKNRRFWTVDFAKDPYELVALCQPVRSSSPEQTSADLRQLSFSVCTDDDRSEAGMASLQRYLRGHSRSTPFGGDGQSPEQRSIPNDGHRYR